MITGTTMDRKDTIAETVSSTKLTIGLATPPVVAVTAGRKSNDLAACTVPATTSPRIHCKDGIDRCHDLGAGCEQDRARDRPYQCLNNIIYMVDGRNLVCKEFHDQQYHHSNDHPLISEQIIRLAEFQQVGKARHEAHN